MPNLTARMEYLKAIYARYHKASRAGKSRLLDEFCKVCHSHRKHALRLLHGPLPRTRTPQLHRRRPLPYGPAVLQAARMIGKASGDVCGQRLNEAMPLGLPALTPRWSLSAASQRQLLSISARQLDARLKPDTLSLRRARPMPPHAITRR